MKRKNMVVGMKVLAKSSEDLKDFGVKKGAEGVIDYLEPLDYIGDYVVRVDFEGVGPLWLTADVIKPGQISNPPRNVWVQAAKQDKGHEL